MPKFKVQFEHWWREVATAEIEAETPEEALKIAQEGSYEFSEFWEDGDMTKDEAIYAVDDENGVTLLNEQEIAEINK